VTASAYGLISGRIEIGIGITPSRDPRAFPNPTKPGGIVRITNLEDNSTVKIYTISGKLVQELEKSVDGETSWDMENEIGNSVRPGLYIYSMTDEQGNKKTGKIVIK
ncbi:unnamed protein product, partial [marine sediment metagenome]